MSKIFSTTGLGSLNCSGNATIAGDLKVTGTTDITGATNSTGNITGNLTGNVTGDVTGNVTIPASTAPASASDNGQPGQIAWDANFIYVCVATNTWKRAALSSWE